MNALEVAQYMLHRLEQARAGGSIWLEHSDIIQEIEDEFGNDWIVGYKGDGAIIHPKVLAAFRVLADGSVAWHPGYRAWHWREKDD